MTLLDFLFNKEIDHLVSFILTSLMAQLPCFCFLYSAFLLPELEAPRCGHSNLVDLVDFCLCVHGYGCA